MFASLRKFITRSDPMWRFLHRLSAPGRILELGCGRGNNCQVASDIYPDAEIHGVDLLDNTAVAEVVIYKKLDLDDCILPYPDDFFDAIILKHVIEHLRYPWRLGAEINRVMKKGGGIYVEAPNWTSILVPSFGFKREQYNPFNFFDDQTHLRPWTKQALYGFLGQNCKLRVARVGTVRNWLKIPFDLVRLFLGFIKGERQPIVLAFWNLYGWCIYAVGVKE